MEPEAVPMEWEATSEAPPLLSSPAADLLLLSAAPPAGLKRDEDDVQLCSGSKQAHSVLLCVAHRCVQVPQGVLRS